MFVRVVTALLGLGLVSTATFAQAPPPAPAVESVVRLAQAAPEKQRKAPPRAPTAAAVGEGELIARVNNWTVGLAGGLPEGLFLRFAAEIARNLNGTPDLRVLPMVTPGATDNIKDLLYLKGVDVAITHADVFEHFRRTQPIANLERRVNYISELYISELHVLVRPEINSLADLAGKRVSFHTQGAGPTVTGPIVFDRLGIQVEPVFMNNAIALEKMRTGEIAGLIHTVGKPVELFTKFKNDAGFKFLPIPFDKFEDLYVPSTLTAEDYPGYIKPGEKVDTIGVTAVLAVYNWPREHDRFRRVARFIDNYIEKFDAFREAPYHPKWKDINLAAKVPGWTRYWVVEEKLAALALDRTRAGGMTADSIALARAQVLKAAPGNAAEQERLFNEFMAWKKRTGR
ncbi:MAG: C4-dicarboxylate ABC transporter [Gammaproteobacteria bacterium]|nr:C4-dicarboxylate ABC transporter [Gammaproteobacteria bacterium]